MKCEMCEHDEASILIRQIFNNKKKSMKLCESCARKAGFIGKSGKEQKFNISQLFFNHFSESRGKKIAGFHKSRHSGNGLDKTRLNKECPGCGTTLQSVIKERKCGCAQCFVVFKDVLQRGLKKYLGVAVHKGKYPKRLKAYKTCLFDIRELKEKLKTALSREDYESAAILRDKIKTLKNTNW